MNFLSQFASENTEASGDIFTALGIDWRLLILQIIAFMILVFLLGKFVYPWLIKAVDSRQEQIDATSKALEEAQKLSADNQAQVTELLDKARKEAADIVGTAKQESADMVAKSEEKAKTSAEQIVASAHQEMDKDIENARKMLYNETLDLVSLATEKVVGVKIDKKADSELITRAVKESK